MHFSYKCSLVCISLGFSTVAAYAGDNIDAYIHNETKYPLRISKPWVTNYSGGNKISIDNHPVAAGRDSRVASFDEGSSNVKSATKLTGAYDVYDVAGNWIGNCTISYWGKPAEINNAQANHQCIGNATVSTSKEHWDLGDGGKVIFTFKEM